MTNELAKVQETTMSLNTIEGFKQLQLAAKMMSASDLVPKRYQNPTNGIANSMIALEMASRMGANPLMVMQHLYVVHGSPAWSSTFLIAAVEASGRFSPMRFEWRGDPGTDEFKKNASSGCRAYAIEKETGERLNGTWVTMEMVKAEGWWDRKSRDGGVASKWPTLTQQMFMYRAASFWSRVYAPGLTMGFRTVEEQQEITDAEYTEVPPVSDDGIKAAMDIKQPEQPVQAPKDPVAPASKQPGRVVEKSDKEVKQAVQAELLEDEKQEIDHAEVLRLAVKVLQYNADKYGDACVRRQLELLGTTPEGLRKLNAESIKLILDTYMSFGDDYPMTPQAPQALLDKVGSGRGPAYDVFLHEWQKAKDAKDE